MSCPDEPLVSGASNPPMEDPEDSRRRGIQIAAQIASGMGRPTKAYDEWGFEVDAISIARGEKIADHILKHRYL